MELAAQKAINSLIWIVCGIVLLTVRTDIILRTSVLVWEALGLGMIAYGGIKLLWVLARGTPTKPAISKQSK